METLIFGVGLIVAIIVFAVLTTAIGSLFNGRRNRKRLESYDRLSKRAERQQEVKNPEHLQERISEERQSIYSKQERTSVL